MGKLKVVERCEVVHFGRKQEERFLNETYWLFWVTLYINH